MKRSEINAIILKADAFLKEYQFLLPPFAYWTPEEWAGKGEETRQIVARRIGWDMTDFGQEDFEKIGLSNFTLRNGSLDDLKRGRGELYCEKILIVGVDQVTPLHFHWNKTEDIINRGGGRLVIQLYNATEDEELADSEVTVHTDGIERCVEAGGTIILNPGESITLLPYCYHAFWAINSPVLVGEVSLVNDDNSDNRFYESIGRFPKIEEDEPPLYLMVNDYEMYYQPEKSKVH
jgi:D-lyxose ketol-isomerase